MSVLSSEHRHMLEVGSAISPEIIEEAGLYTVTSRAGLKQIGFPSAEPPALALPVLTWASGPSPVHWRIRPDRPKLNAQGKTAKYLQPRGTECRLYCPPTARNLIECLQGVAGRTDPALTYVFVTEGEKKVLSLVTKRLAALGLAGVWNWRQKAALRGDFDVIGLKGMKVCIVFDSDAATNPQVAKAEDALASMLRAIGADVYVCRLPAMPVGRKVGVDDFFADGHTVDDLSGLIGPHIPSAHALQEPYREHDGRIERFVPPKQREEDGQFVAVTLNYTAQVVAEKVWDDGIDQNLVFTIEGALSDGRQLATVDVPAAQFQSWSWVTSRWGIRARLTVGMNAEKHAAAAVQYLSSDVPQRLVFGHTGWRHVNGRNVFLHADGAIGEDGLDESIETELDQFLKPYALPEPPQGSQLLGAVRASVGVLCAAPAHIVGPLWACVWRSVFGDAAFSVFLVGPTGTRKSSLAAVLVSHFGASLARKESLTQNWSSTANALEGAAFYAKDVILVIDDFVPSRGTSGDRQQMEKLASRILRSSGNQSGRSRMKADGRLHAVRPNRALIVSTGEELPDGASELRRALVLELSSGDIDLDGLTRCQVDGEEGMLACCLAAFLQWAAPRLTDLRDRIRTAVRSSRDGTRATEIGAELSEAARIWSEFARDAGLPAAEVSGVLEVVLGGIAEAVAEQATVSADQDPVGRFLEVLGDGLTAGEFHVLSRRDDNSGPEAEFPRHSPASKHVGWMDDSELFLIPQPAYAAACKLAEAAGRPIHIRERGLWKRMRERGLLTIQGEGGRNTCRLSFPGHADVRVVVFSRALLASEPGSFGSSGTTRSSIDSKEAVTLPEETPEIVQVHTEPGVPNGSAGPELRADNTEAVTQLPETPKTPDPDGESSQSIADRVVPSNREDQDQSLFEEEYISSEVKI